LTESKEATAMATSKTSASAILKELKGIAPSIAFGVDYEVDPNFVWDGDGPDPREEGFEAYDIDVSATAVEDGKMVVGHGYLGGSYERPGEFDPDIGGYLPQMLQEAVQDLATQVSGDLLAQANAADKYLDEVLHLRYEEHMK
jgi:hypothetical protein